MKVVSITGSTGFIGSHLLKEINKENFKINLLSRKKIKINNKKNTYISFDLDNKYNNCFKKIGSPNVLIHLAWGGIPNYTSKYHLKEELKKQYIFLSSCIKNGLKNLIITGTCLEYGDINGRLNENMIEKPKIAYAKAKHKLYKKIIKLKKKYNFNLVWARVFYVYGENSTHKTIYSELKEAINNNQKFFNMSPGDQIRDYIHISELIKILILFTKLHKDIGIINICSGKKLMLKTIVKNWIKKNKSLIKINTGYYKYNTYEPKNIIGSTKKLNYFLKNK